MAVELVDKTTGFLVRQGLDFAPALARDQGKSVDYVHCINLTGATMGPYTNATGWPVVEIDWSNYKDGHSIPIKLASLGTGASSTQMNPLGVIRQGTQSVANGAPCLVQIFGKHRAVTYDGVDDADVGNQLVPSASTPGTATLTAANGSLGVGQTQTLQSFGTIVESAGSGTLVVQAFINSPCNVVRK